MPNPFRGDRLGRRARESGRRGGVSCAVSGPASRLAEEEETVIDPVELLAIRADDEILDDLAFGLSPASVFGPGAGAGHDLTSCLGSDPRYTDDLRLLALLREWRHDVDDEPWSELVSVEQARAAVLAGAVRPALTGPPVVLRGRRPTPIAALAVASVVAALGMSGLAIAASQARPGDALWGVSKMLDAQRATSLEAEGRVGVALASARRALAEGRHGDAQAELAGAAGELQRVRDSAIRQDLARTAENLTATASTTPEGRKVDTNEHGEPTGPTRDPSQAGVPGDPSRDPSSTSNATTPADQGGPGGDQDRRASDRPTASSRPTSSSDADARRRRVAPESPAPSAGARPTRPEPTTTRPEPTTTRPEPTTTRPEPTMSQPEPTTTRPEPTTTQTTRDAATPDRQPGLPPPPRTAAHLNGRAPIAHGR